MGELIRLFGSFTVFFLPPQTSLPPPLIGRSDGRLPPQSATNFSGFCWNRLCGISWSKEWWKYGQLLPPHPFFPKPSVSDCAQIQPFVVMRIQTHFKCIWVKLPWTYIFPKYCHFFCNFDTCFQALFALVLLFLLFLWVNHLCQSRENQVFDPSPQVRYLKTTSKHGRFWGF